MFIVEVGCNDGSVYSLKYRSDDIDYVLKDIRKWIRKIGWTNVEDIIIRKEDE